MSEDGYENLLEETLRDMKAAGETPADVVYIGSRDGYSCTWDEFTRLADRRYYASYGGAEVAQDLQIHFRDGSWLERGEYDGSEWWALRRPFVTPGERKPIERLIRDDEHYDSDSLSRLHSEDPW